MERLSLDKKSLKKFSITMFVALIIIGTILFLRHKSRYVWFYSIGLLLFLLGKFAPDLLKPIYIIWMRLAFVLSWINTHLILLIIFYLIFTPIGLAMRLFRVDLLDRKINRFKESYWKEKQKKEFSPSDYERQF